MKHNGALSILTPFSSKSAKKLEGAAQWGGKGGRVPPLTAKNLQNLEKSGKIRKNLKKIGKRKNRKETAKIRKFLSLCPSWQIGLATLLVPPKKPNWMRGVRGLSENYYLCYYFSFCTLFHQCWSFPGQGIHFVRFWKNRTFRFPKKCCFMSYY